MRNILQKEIRLSASKLSFLFILFSFMFFLPGYPILCGVFFVTLGLFQSFQNARESSDILFSTLLPIAKSDIVKGKYLFVCFIEVISLLLMLLSTLVRMTILESAPFYRNNALMNANFFAMSMAFVIFGMFNLLFVNGFFKTAYKFSKPFVLYIIVAFLLVFLAESLHFFPGLEMVNAFGFDYLFPQLLFLVAGLLLYGLFTIFAVKSSIRHFEKIDL